MTARCVLKLNRMSFAKKGFLNIFRTGHGIFFIQFFGLNFEKKLRTELELLKDFHRAESNFFLYNHNLGV